MTELLRGKSLLDLAREIEGQVKKSDESLIQAAMLLREARTMFDAAGDNSGSWKEWTQNNIDLCPSRLRDLQRIADADDPAAELERQRGLNRDRVQRHRAKQADQAQKLEKDRRVLIDWAKTAPIDQVRQAIKQFCREAGEASRALNDAGPAVESQLAA